MSPVDDIVALAERHEAAALRTASTNPAQALEDADMARLLREGASALLGMPPAEQQDYAHRLKLARWMRLDDSPIDFDEEATP